jgi:hypothetical protein
MDADEVGALFAMIDLGLHFTTSCVSFTRYSSALVQLMTPGLAFFYVSRLSKCLLSP